MKNGISAMSLKYNGFAEKNYFFKLLNKVKYELPVLAFLLTIYAFKHDYYTGDVYNIVHIFDYRIGFAPRLFIGSLMSLFTNYKSIVFINRFFNIVCILSIFLLSFTTGRVIRKADDKVKYTTMIFVSLFLVVPYSCTVLYPRLVSLDRFLVIFTLLALMALCKKGFKWFVPLLIMMSLAVYHGYAFTYMPVVAILLIYEVNRNNKSKQSIALCVVSFAVMAAFSAYFFLYQGVKYSAGELIAYSVDKTDIRDHVGEWDMRSVLEAVLVKSPGEFWALSLQGGVLKNLGREAVGMLYLLPLLFIFALIWISAVKKSNNIFEKYFYLLCMAAPLMRLPMLVLSQNYFRSRVSVVIVQFFLIFYFLYIRDSAVSMSAEKIGNFLKKNYILTVAFVLYFLFIVKV